MVTTTLSQKGQLVIPAQVRRELGWEPGDVLVMVADAAAGSVVMHKRESLETMAARFTEWIKPGTPPLEDVHALYERREPRV